MLYRALVFLLIACVAAFFGFGGAATSAAGLAQILFVIAMMLCVLSVIANFLQRSP
jgi:uncharacterized membrane protein YtjA (UPF0391 family)